MTPLETELVALAPYLAHGDGDDLPGAVLRRLAGDSAPRARADRAPVRPTRRPLVILTAAAVIVALVLAVAPARRAVARLFRIGAVEIRPSGPTTTAASSELAATTSAPGTATTAPSTTASPGTVTSVATTSAPTQAGVEQALDDARRRLPFAIRLADPATAGELRAVDLDERVPGGLVALTYDTFTLVEVASAPNSYPVMAKLAPPGVEVQFVRLGTGDAVWVQGAHQIAYVGPDGAIRNDTMRRSGSALVWTAPGVTLRIEGLDDRDGALAVAAGVR